METAHRLKSVHLGNERSVWVRAPRDPAKPAALTIVLDGEIYRDQMGVVKLLDSIQAKHGAAPSWYVFVANASEEARWLECPCYPPFARFILEELLPWVARTYPATKKSRERVIVGLSYTGLAATYVAMKSEGEFTKVIAQSGSYWWNDCWLIKQFRKRKKRLPTDFYLDVGTRETDVDVDHRSDVFQGVSQLDATRQFRDVLLKQGYVVKYVEFNGGHKVANWKKTLPAALRWALPP